MNSMSSGEEYFYSDDEDENINDTSLEKGESKLVDEDIPEYNKITEKNMYEFMIWANEKREKSVSVNDFNMILQSKIYKWIEKNNITWQYALTLVTDIINNQKNIGSHFDISSNLNEIVEPENVEEMIKPTSIEEKRKLFAAAAEKRAAKRF